MKNKCCICKREYKYEMFVRVCGIYVCPDCADILNFAKPRKTNFTCIARSTKLVEKCANDEGFDRFCFESCQRFKHLDFGVSGKDFQLDENGHLVVQYNYEEKYLFIVYLDKILLIILPDEFEDILGYFGPCFESEPF